MSKFRIGQGYDVHRLVKGRRLIIGGVDIPFEKGLLGHSDADVLSHAIADAILGAAALGDIGRHFPDNDPAFKDADSIDLLRQVVALTEETGWRPSNVDATIIAQAPKMAPYVDAMRERIAKATRLDLNAVNVKATTTETLDATGRGEGIASMAIVLLVKSGDRE